MLLMEFISGADRFAGRGRTVSADWRQNFPLRKTDVESKRKEKADARKGARLLAREAVLF
jgi:hypothetical protein